MVDGQGEQDGASGVVALGSVGFGRGRDTYDEGFL